MQNEDVVRIIYEFTHAKGGDKSALARVVESIPFSERRIYVVGASVLIYVA